jgi:hypothetical protein
VQIHQLIHGYSNGHQRLAGSVRLEAKDSSLIDRLSDLSGVLVPSSIFRPYLTGYPLPSQTYYAIARTWLDEKAARAGCVLTHTLLMPLEEFGDDEDPSWIEDLFLDPRSVSSLSVYDRPCDAIRAPRIPNPVLRRDSIALFVRKFFGEAIRPIIWVGANEPEEISWLILKSIWPRLRMQFSFCTYSLQPRSMQQRPFDLEFVPRPAKRKFVRLGSQHLIDEEETHDLQLESWEQRVVSQLKLHISMRLVAFPQLWESLDSDPRSLPRLFRLAELLENDQSTAVSVAAALDLLGALAPQPSAAISEKEIIVRRAIRNICNVPPLEVFEALRFVSSRVSTRPYSSIKPRLWDELVDRIASEIADAPEAAIFAAVADYGEKDNAFVEGVAQGLARLSQRDVFRFLRLPQFDSLAKLVLRYEPEAIASSLSGSLDHQRFAQLDIWVGELCKEQLPKQQRRRIINSLVSIAVEKKNVDLLKALLELAGTDNIGDYLEDLGKLQRTKHKEFVEGFLLDVVCTTKPEAVRSWFSSHGGNDFASTNLIAATYPNSEESLNALIQDSPGGTANALLISFIYVHSRNGALPLWLKKRLETDERLIVNLLTRVTTDREQLGALVRSLRFVPNSPIAPHTELISTISDYHAAGVHELSFVVYSSILSSYLGDRVEKDVYQKWEESRGFSEWLALGNNAFEVFLQTMREAPSQERGWDWLGGLHEPLFAAHQALLVDVIERLSRITTNWTETESINWAVLLKRSRGCWNRYEQLKLHCQALNYAFQNVRHPLSKVVVESFPQVYISVSENSPLSYVADVMFGFFTWDRAKELRRRIVDCFARSKWSIEDLAFAMPDPLTFRKVVKRLSSELGDERLVREMLFRLKQSTDRRAAELTETARSVLDDPFSHEPWL